MVVTGVLLCVQCLSLREASTARGFAPLDPLERISNQGRACPLGSHCHGTNRGGPGVGAQASRASCTDWLSPVPGAGHCCVPELLRLLRGQRRWRKCA